MKLLGEHSFLNKENNIVSVAVRNTFFCISQSGKYSIKQKRP